jgi:hypothetical protein
MNKNEKINYTKRYSDAKRDARVKIKGSNCMICKLNVSSFCDSHSIPISIYNKMNLDDGKLCNHETVSQNWGLTDIYSGKMNSGIFRNICNSCDQLFFSKLDNTDVLKECWEPDTIRLQAIRILLYEIYRKQEFILTLVKTLPTYLSKEEYSKELLLNKKMVDDFDKEYKAIMLNENYEFNIIYEKILDYETDFACVTLFHLMMSPGTLTFIDGSDRDNIENYIYAVVLPNNGKTKIILFCKESSPMGIILNVELETATDDSERLEMISQILSIWGNNLHGNKNFFKKYSIYNKCINEVVMQCGKKNIDLKSNILLYQEMQKIKYTIF